MTFFAMTDHRRHQGYGLRSAVHDFADALPDDTRHDFCGCFAGPLPQEWGDWARLVDLDLSQNELTGTITLPGSVGPNSAWGCLSEYVYPGAPAHDRVSVL
jgi:hypothetical protein